MKRISQESPQVIVPEQLRGQSGTGNEKLVLEGRARNSLNWFCHWEKCPWNCVTRT